MVTNLNLASTKLNLFHTDKKVNLEEDFCIPMLDKIFKSHYSSELMIELTKVLENCEMYNVVEFLLENQKIYEKLSKNQNNE